MLPLVLLLWLSAADLGRGLANLAADLGAVGEAVSRSEAPGPGERSGAPAFVAQERAVDNWRGQAVAALEPLPLTALAVALRVGRPVVTRCVKLNNYWCIKQARWAGAIGADEEGHVAFASAAQGADAALSLLRRYYLDYGRKSALAIVRRWAPAECTATASPDLPFVLAVRGLSNTLRARFLAARRVTRPHRARGPARKGTVVQGRRSGLKVSVVPLRPLPLLRAPAIAAGMGERPRTAPPPPTGPAYRPASRSARPGRKPRIGGAVALASTAPTAKPIPAPACTGDEQRIRNYAAAIARRADRTAEADLGLFDATGRPQPNLFLVMLAMSGVELGWLHASPALVAAAIEQGRRQAEAAAMRAADATVPAP